MRLFLDWTDTSEVGDDYDNLDVSLSGLTRSILIAALRGVMRRCLWTEGDADVSDETWDTVDAALAQAMLEVNTAIMPATPTDFVTLYDGNSSAGGSAASGWQYRLLGYSYPTSLPDWISLASNIFTLQPGEYALQMFCPAYQTGYHQAALWNVDTARIEVAGSSEYAQAASGGTPQQTTSTVEYRFTVAVATQYRAYHYCQLAKSTNGLGLDAGTAYANIFNRVNIWRLSD